MAEEVQKETAENKPEEQEIKKKSLLIAHPDGDCLFYFPENAKIELLEQAAYRLLSEFIIAHHRPAVIESYKKALIEEAQAEKSEDKEADEVEKSEDTKKQADRLK